MTLALLAGAGRVPVDAILPESVGPYLALMVIGFVVGAAGHLFRLRWMVAAGIIMIFLATLLLPLAINLFDREPEPPGPNVPTPY